MNVQVNAETISKMRAVECLSRQITRFCPFAFQIKVHRKIEADKTLQMGEEVKLKMF